MHFLFITDAHHNYVCLYKELKGGNFPKLHNDDADVEIKVRAAFRSKDVEFERVDVVKIPFSGITMATFHRVIVTSRVDPAPFYFWHAIGEYHTFHINSTCLSALKDIRLPSSLVTCGAVVMGEDGNDFLLVKGRKSGKWGFPKGHCHPSEDPRVAASRELHEETGLHMIVRDDAHYITHKKMRFYVMKRVPPHELPNPSPLDREEISSARWVRKEHLASLNLTNPSKCILSKLIHSHMQGYVA